MGPFTSYVPPGVYTQTLNNSVAATTASGVRIPAIVGVGQEELEQTDFELVRGSSALIDTQIVAEDPSASWIVDSTNPNRPILGAQDGTYTAFRVKNFPMVDGQGFGRTTNDVRSVSVTVNGSVVAVGNVQGAKGWVTLQVPTQPNDVVRVTYYFHRGDTQFNDVVSEQVTATNATLITPGYAPFDITTGSNDTLELTVNETSYSVTLPQGSLTVASLVTSLNSNQIPNLVVSAYTDNLGLNHLQFTTPVGLTIGSGNANGPLGLTAGQTTDRNKSFRVYNRPITDGLGSGTTTTDPSKVVVKVNGTQVVANAVDGANGIVTLSFAPAPGAAVDITYWANTWQDTFDYLPNSQVTTVIRAGIAPNRSDYVSGADYVISNPTADTSIINWGASWVVSPATSTVGSTPFGGSDTGGQVTGTLIDDQFYLGECTRVIDTSTIPATVSGTDYLLPEVPTMGNGRSTALGLALYNSVANSRQNLITNRPDLVKVYTGRTLSDALNRQPVAVKVVDGANRRITLKSNQPPDYNAYATFYYSRLRDDTYILTSTVPGPIGTGQYTVYSSNYDSLLYQVAFGTKSGLSQIVQWPRGVENIPDAFHTGDGTPVGETVTVTFGNSAATNAVWTSSSAGPFSFYTPYSATWVTKVNGSDVSTNLVGAAAAYLVSDHVALNAGSITIPASPGNVLNLRIDGTVIPITLTAGSRTPAQIVTEVNAAIDAATGFTATAPNALFSAQTIAGTAVFIVKSLAVPGALPAGFDSPSAVRIDPGTVETVLGFQTFQLATGTPGAINKPATMLGTGVGPFSITASLNDGLNVRVNGIDYMVQLTAGPAVSAADLVIDINAVIPGTVASVGTGSNANKIRLTSPTNGTESAILILSGNANSVLGFTENAFAGQSLVTVQEVVDVLNATVGFAAGAIAYPESLNGQTYLTIESLTTGATTSSIGFSNSANSAFNATTGIAITPGTSGDVGEDAHNQFVVSSSSTVGSSGIGIPGQTYTDVQTGLRFTVLASATGTYTPGGSFTLQVTPTFTVNPSIPRYPIGGLELTISNTVGIGVNDTAQLVTYNPTGIEPAVGDFYYITYNYRKQDYSAAVYQTLKSIEANFGRVSAENRLSLGAYLSLINGAVLVVLKQVLKEPNSNQASDQAYIAGIGELASPLAGNIRPNIVIPLSTSTQVYTYLTQHCLAMSSIRNASERMGFIGFASGTIPTTAQTIAKGLASNRIVAFYPDSAIITLTDELGRSFESVVDGSMYAAAFSGAAVSTAVDVATPYTRRVIQGFTRIPRKLDPVEANQTAIAGITILEDLDPVIRVRQGLTTDMRTVLNRIPSVTQIADFVQQQARGVLDGYIGSKYLATRTQEVIVSLNALFRSLIQGEIVTAYGGMSAQTDPDDPTVLRVEMMYSPVFPLEYIVITFNLRASL